MTQTAKRRTGPQRPVRPAIRTPAASAAPAPEVYQAPEPALIRIMRAILPPRAAEDALAGIVRIDLGPRTIILPAMPIGPERAWKQEFAETMGRALSGMSLTAEPQAVLGFFGGLSEEQITLLIAYDQAGALPDREWIEAHATSGQILRAVLAVTAAVYPFVAIIVQSLVDSADLRETAREVLAAFTNGSLTPTAGPPATSNGT